MDGHETFQNPFDAVKIIQELIPQKFLQCENDLGKEEWVHSKHYKEIEEKPNWRILGSKVFRTDAIAIRLQLQEEEGNAVGQQIRFFRNHPSLRYKDAVHNKLVVNTNATMSAPNLIIQHWRSDDKRLKRRKQRDEMIFNSMMERSQKDVNDLRAWYYLGTYYLANYSYHKAIKCLKNYISKSDFVEEKYLAMFYQAQAYYFLYNKKKNPNYKLQARKIMIEMLGLLWDMPLAYCALGDLAQIDTKYRESENWYKIARYHNRLPQVSCFFPRHFFTWYPWNCLTIIYSKAGKIPDAILSGKKCLEFDDFPRGKRKELENCILNWEKEYERQTGKPMFSFDRARNRESGNGDSYVKRNTQPRIPDGRLVKADVGG